MTDFYNAALWEEAWNDESQLKIDKMKKKGIDPTRSFDHKAEIFNEQSFNEEGKKRTKRIMNWLEEQGVSFEHNTILDIGAASGVFTVPFAQRGARITAVETSPPQIKLLEKNVASFATNQVTIVPTPFEDIDIEVSGWSRAFDLVFASMSPVIQNWESVEKLLQCTRKFCYISLPVLHTQHSLVKEIWPFVTTKPYPSKLTEMGYLLHLLYLKGFEYQSLLTREEQTKEVSLETALEETITWLGHHHLSVDEQKRQMIADYLAKTYSSGQVVIREGGRYGKVLIRL